MSPPAAGWRRVASLACGVACSCYRLADPCLVRHHRQRGVQRRREQAAAHAYVEAVGLCVRVADIAHLLIEAERGRVAALDDEEEP